jgi:hypothetical protein
MVSSACDSVAGALEEIAWAGAYPIMNEAQELAPVAPRRDNVSLTNLSRFTRWRRPLALWGIPVLLLPVLYWGGLVAWFQRDDFAMLSLRTLLASGRSLSWVLFAPVAQGTIRTLSERLFYVSFSALFGLNSLPYRAAAFLTFATALMLLQGVCSKLTGSRAAGFWAAIFWLVNSALAIPLSWTAEYYELLCAFFFLLDFWLLIRYAETGERRFYIAQWVTFLAGFGVLELNVVYPALATVYALCYVPRLLRKVLPLFAVSFAYMAVHIAVAPLPAAGPYTLYWDWHVFQTLATFSAWALGPAWLSLVGVHSLFLRFVLTALLGAGLISFAVCKLRQRQWRVLLFPAWFVIVLSPLLPLRQHVSYEYLTVPLIGLAMWAGAAVVAGFEAGSWKRVATVLLLATYIGVSIPIGHSLTRLYHDRSIRARDLVFGVAALNETRPDSIVILKGVSAEMFDDTIYPRALQLAGVREVYVVSDGDERRIIAGRTLDSAASFLIDGARERDLLAEGRAVVYDVSNGVRDVTAESGIASRIEMGDTTRAKQLGPSWYPREGSYRWMPKRASVMLRRPRELGEKLYLKGYCPAAALRTGPLAVEVRVDGEKLPLVSVQKPNAEFSFSLPLPAEAKGKAKIVVEVEVGRTFHAPGDNRELGLVFSSMEIR